MVNEILSLIILFFVIFDPLLSFGVFAAATKSMKYSEKQKIALLSVGLALGISFVFLIFGESILSLFSTSLDDFRVAGGIILGILSLHMIVGTSAQKLEKTPKNSGMAVAAIIATPLLTGPAAITAILINVQDFGMIYTGLSLTLVLIFTGILFLLAEKVQKILRPLAIEVISTMLGLVTLSWSVEFIRQGLGF